MNLSASSRFVPLTSVAANKPPASNGAFAPVVQTAAAPPPGTAHSPVATAPPTHPASHGTPKLTVERDGDHITRIVIHCSCGEVIPVDCHYSDPGESALNA